MTLDDVLAAYTDALEAEIAILRQVESLGDCQRAAFARGELVDLAGLANRRAELMDQFAAVETRLAPWRMRIVANLLIARASSAFPAVETRGRELQTLVQHVMDRDRRLLTDLEATLDQRRREAHG